MATPGYKLQVSFIRHVHTVAGTMYSEMFSAGFRDCATTTIKKEYIIVRDKSIK